ncbi:MAG: cytochrome c-type biogenesis protein CcmH [Actinomycetota bacterium]|nr:cytochrome c-type biogenesis protein CcmH [Actinomycetota bacterium]
MTRRSMAWVIIVLLAIASLGVAAFDDGVPRTEAERTQALAQRFACPECDGQSVADSNASVAANIRELIRSEVAAGATDDEIRDRLLRAYGTDVLLNPPATGVSLLIWVLPAVVVVGAVGALVSIALRRRTHTLSTDDDRRLVDAALRTREWTER